MFDIDTDGGGVHTGCDYQWVWFRDNGNNLLSNGLDKLYKQMGGNAVFFSCHLDRADEKTPIASHSPLLLSESRLTICQMKLPGLKTKMPE